MDGHGHGPSNGSMATPRAPEEITHRAPRRREQRPTPSDSGSRFLRKRQRSHRDLRRATKGRVRGRRRSAVPPGSCRQAMGGSRGGGGWGGGWEEARTARPGGGSSGKPPLVSLTFPPPAPPVSCPGDAHLTSCLSAAPPSPPERATGPSTTKPGHATRHLLQWPSALSLPWLMGGRGGLRMYLPRHGETPSVSCLTSCARRQQRGRGSGPRGKAGLGGETCLLR